MPGTTRAALICGAASVGLVLLAGCGQGPAVAGQPQLPPAAAPTALPAATSTQVPAGAPSTTATPVPAAVPREATALPTGVPAGRPVPTTRPGRPTTTAPADSNAVIGPFGWQTLKLGMTAAQVEDLGVAVPSGSGICRTWSAVGATPLESVSLHSRHGVTAVEPNPVTWLHTPEGMAVGWTPAQVAAAYPAFAPADAATAGVPIPATGNPAAVYRLWFESGTLARFTLESKVNPCG